MYNVYNAQEWSGLGKVQSITVGLYLIIKKCSVHIKVTSVCRQLRKIEVEIEMTLHEQEELEVFMTEMALHR